MTDHVVHTEVHIKGGIEYTINVIKEKGLLYGGWVCECGAKGGSSGSSSDNQAAVASAVINLHGHHTMEHAK